MQDPRHPTGQPLHPQQPAQRPTIPQHPQAPTIRPQAPGPQAPAPQAPRPMAPAHRPPQSPDDEPIALIDDDLDTASTKSTEEFTKKIKAIGEAGMHKKHHDWKRKVHATGTGAIRVRSFHGKYSDQGLQYLDDAINEWLDANPEIEIKFVTSTVGVFEGKIREPALVLNLWY